MKLSESIEEYSIEITKTTDNGVVQLLRLSSLLIHPMKGLIQSWLGQILNEGGALNQTEKKECSRVSKIPSKMLLMSLF